MKRTKKQIWQAVFLAALIIGTVLIITQQRNTPYQHDTGLVFGTEYHVTYQSNTDLQQDIEAELHKVDSALSPFNPKSVITQVNQNKPVTLNKMFTDVFTLAEKISKDTGGAFDITVAPLVNVWGFGFKTGKQPNKHDIDSLKQIVGFQKVHIQQDRVIKTDPRIMLDCSGIAKGYGVDAVANLLRRKGIDNFMVEIGGEVITSGINEKRVPW